jgi:hypothetical protein
LALVAWLAAGGVCAPACFAADPQKTAQLPASRYFAIEVVDDQTARHVPLVELTTTTGKRFVTDSAGVVAIDDPELLGREVFFHVASHGYEFPKDGFGFRGKRLSVESGRTAMLEIRRLNVAERMYRVTGAGIYCHQVRLGRRTPLPEPLLNAEVAGSDSVQAAVYRGRMHWFWGDTHRLSYPLGNFHVPGAVSQLPSDGGLHPEWGVQLEYFRGADGFARPTAQMAGDGPTWLAGLSVVPDAAGNQTMLAAYMKVRGMLSVYRRGLMRWDDQQERFVHVADVPADAPLFPRGHALLAKDGGTRYVYYCDPFPLVRVPATAESVLDLSQYEAFTCLSPGPMPADGRVPAERLEKSSSGRLRWGWRRAAPPLTPPEEARLVAAGAIAADDSRFQLRDAAGGKRVTLHSGSVAWNEYRRRYVLIAVEHFGTSLLGEVWCAEADSLVGPWSPARKIVTHDKYSFYNPMQHPALAQRGGREIYFEGTYSRTFSGNNEATPLYDYNQIMYRLDLADERLGFGAPAR